LSASIPAIPENRIFNRLIDSSEEHLLSKSSGEFCDRDLEECFLKDTWADYKKGPQYVLLVGGSVLIAFVLTDLLSVEDLNTLLSLSALRITTGLFLIGSGLSIRRSSVYFASFHQLCLWNQLISAVVIIGLGIIKSLPFIHNAFHLFMVTLMYYQFLHNRFIYTILASAFFSLAYCIVTTSSYLVVPVDVVRFVLYLGLANGLGVFMLRSLNYNRRKTYIQHYKERHAKKRLAATVAQLLQAQKEVKTLEGLLPICSRCKQIRDDNGYWNQIEAYLHEHSRLQFSHSLCPTCAQDLYPDLKLTKK
jgi:hypothetical protein